MKVNFVRKLALLLCVALFAFASCTKEDVTANTESEKLESMDSMEKESPKEDMADVNADGVIYVNRAGLYTETDDGKMKWAAEASLGDVAMYLGEKKEAQRTDGQKRSFFHISLKDKEYWVQDYCYEPNTVPAFISAADTVLYKSESLTAATDEVIPQYFIVAVYKDSLNASNQKFVKIAAYCPELITSWIVKEKYVKRDAVEFEKTNTDAMLLAQVAMESQNETIRAELFQNAIEMNSRYSDDIAILQNLARVIDAENAFLKKVEAEKIEKKLIAKQDVELLSIPYLEGDVRLLATVKADTVLHATKKLVSTGPDGSQTEWYYVQNKQKKGWAQASYLEEK
ncbi:MULTISPECIES: hypothetical protein [unclassified Treponema]|uniref:hypothetical protein n=1 Tax=unclassified Treponema TaxID=2638727 RepID=UPI0020A4C4A0|nr:MULTISPECIES: hypothetical protein [unclassified Treponema]UTC67435.1 hypothetical protein E4O06_01835 [Treponema sp. OMZ 789]UTC70164.1 hypothetical protein E4O01_01830 [Treponema sp. OMZ 790]UTC72879.1 hypothetical protein E4O02_01830 [Treponema sp. OMZ 791]